MLGLDYTNPNPTLTLTIKLNPKCNPYRLSYWECLFAADNGHALKTGYVEFARLGSSADAVHAAIVRPAVAMAAEGHCQRQPAGAQWLHICTMPIVELLPAIIANSI